MHDSGLAIILITIDKYDSQNNCWIYLTIPNLDYFANFNVTGKMADAVTPTKDEKEAEQ